MEPDVDETTELRAQYERDVAAGAPHRIVVHTGRRGEQEFQIVLIDWIGKEAEVLRHCNRMNKHAGYGGDR